MKILFIVLSGLFLVSTAVFIILYYKMKKRFSNCQLALNTTQNNLIDLQKKVKEEVFSPNRKGFYKKTINLISTEDKQDGKTGEPYEALVYIKEIDKYMNGLSKIEMTDIEIISGFDTSKFGWVETIITRGFSSIKKTSDIEWLESEEDVKEQRKLKLEKILEESNEGTL